MSTARPWLPRRRSRWSATSLVICDQRFLRYLAVSPSTCQEYSCAVKNHVVPCIGHLRISEVCRETFQLTGQGSPVSRLRKLHASLSALHARPCRPCARWRSMRATGPVTRPEYSHPARTGQPILVASHDQWRRLEGATYHFKTPSGGKPPTLVPATSPPLPPGNASVLFTDAAGRHPRPRNSDPGSACA
jgi:hypothetical protein